MLAWSSTTLVVPPIYPPICFLGPPICLSSQCFLASSLDPTRVNAFVHRCGLLRLLFCLFQRTQLQAVCLQPRPFQSKHPWRRGGEKQQVHPPTVEAFILRGVCSPLNRAPTAVSWQLGVVNLFWRPRPACCSYRYVSWVPRSPPKYCCALSCIEQSFPSTSPGPIQKVEVVCMRM